MANTHFPKSGEKGKVISASEPFAEGAMRYAFKGLDENKRVVVKVFKATYAMDKSGWEPEVAMQEKAGYFARLWNQEVLPKKFYTPAREIHFTKIDYCRAIDSGKYHKLHEYKTYEPFMEGNFDKFNSNSGFEGETVLVLATFAHWTFEKSGHRFLVCDLQGVKTDTAYTLTDPVVHSFDQRFGASMVDHGQEGMRAVLEGHRCNELCKALGLPAPVVAKVAGPAAPKSTLFTINLSMVERLRLDAAKRKLPFPLIPEEKEEDDVAKAAAEAAAMEALTALTFMRLMHAKN